MIALSVIVASCSDKNSYNITGTFKNKNLDSVEVYLAKLNDAQNDFVKIDTTKIINGKFSFKGNVSDTASVRFIMINGNTEDLQNPVLFVMEPGNINIVWDTLASVSGTKLNDEYQAYINKRRPIEKKMVQLIEEYQKTMVQKNGQITPAELQSFEARQEPIRKEMSETSFDYVKSMMNTPIGEFMFLSICQSLEDDQMKELLTMLTPEMEKNNNIQQIKKFFDQSENIAEGKDYVDFKALNPNGQEVSLKDYVGKSKYVLVDFWATWCGPCMKELPNLKKIYSEYNKKGLEIVGVSLDEDKDSWLKTIKAENMSWPQVIDSNESASKSYLVESIPYTILIDKEGKIIAKGLTGAELENKLKELFK